MVVVNGVFNAILGSSTPLDLVFDDQRWLGISVEGGEEISPRIQLASAPSALNADRLDGLDATDFSPVEHSHVDADEDWIIDGDNVYPVDSDVGIGTTSPEAKVEIAAGGEGQPPALLLGIRDKLAFRMPDGIKGGEIFVGTNSHMFIDKESTGDLVLRRSNGTVEGLRVKEDGKIGIGAETPENKLHLNGPVRASEFNLRGSIILDYSDSDTYYVRSLGGHPEDRRQRRRPAIHRASRTGHGQ